MTCQETPSVKNHVCDVVDVVDICVDDCLAGSWTPLVMLVPPTPTVVAVVVVVKVEVASVAVPPVGPFTVVSEPVAVVVVVVVVVVVEVLVVLVVTWKLMRNTSSPPALGRPSMEPVV